MLAVNKILTQCLVRYVEVDAYHEAAAAHVGDMLLGGLEFFQFGHEVFACLVCVVDEVFAFYYVEHGQCCGAGHVVAAEGGAQLSVFRFEVGRDEHGAHGKAVADAFGHGDEVGAYAKPLVGEELARTAVAALYLVADEHCAVLLAGCLKPFCEGFVNHLYAAHALYALNDAGANVALGEFGLPCGEVVYGQVGYVVVGVYGCYNLRIVGGFDGKRCASVERLLGRKHARASRLERSQLQRVLVGLGSAVYEEQLVVVVAAQFAKPFGKLTLKVVDYRVAVKAEFAGLFR